MKFMRKRWRRILFFSLPILVGLVLAILARVLMPTVFPVLSSVDFGTAAFVFGMTIRNPGVVAFVFGFLATTAVLAIYYWDQRRVAQAQTMYADYLEDTNQKRRSFLRRLDHEIKNPLTGLRAALVNLQEARESDEHSRAVTNAGRALERLTRLLTDLRKLSDLEERTIERFTSGGTLTYSPLPNLTNKITVGYDFTQQEGRSVQPFGFIPQPDGVITVTTYSRRFLSFDYVGTYSMDVLSGMRANFSWGGQATGDFQANISATGRGFPGAAKPTVNSASSTLGTETRRQIWNSGFFFQNVLDLKNRYFLTLGLRVDGNSTFGRNFNLAMYPKASGSWIVSDGGFWRPEFGEMKLRWAYGLAGRAPGAFVAQRTWSNAGLAGDPAFIPGNLGNPDIGPEVTREIELGFDASWLNDRVRPRFTYYRQTTEDAIQNVSVIPSLGFTSSVAHNIGEVKNWGQEYALDVTALRC